jgi:hypothetical protein
MPITPRPSVLPRAAAEPDKWTDASFQDVTFTQMMAALIASGEYAPGPLIQELALAATSQVMVETGRWDGAAKHMTLAQAQEVFQRMGQRK